MVITPVEVDGNVEIEKRLGRIEQQLENVVTIATVKQSVPLGYSSHVGADEIDLRELWSVVWQGRWWVVGVTFLFAVASVLYALYLPNIYKSEVLLAPAEENSGGGLASMAGQLGGLASLAGVSIGGGGDKTAYAIEVLSSRRFLSNFIKKHDLLVPIMAAKDWDPDSNELIYDTDIYLSSEKKWVRDITPPRSVVPSLLEAVEEFQEIFEVSHDKNTSFVTIKLKFYSPTFVQEVVGWLVEDINFALKEGDVAEATKSIHFLNAQLEKTSVTEMQSIFYQLIEDQTKTIMVAEVRQEYAFKVIDPPVLPEYKVSPSRLLILVDWRFFGRVSWYFYCLLCACI